MTSSSSAAELRVIRKEKRAARRAVTDVDRKLATRRLAAHLLSIRLVRTATTVALYQADDGEPDLGAVIDGLRSLGAEIALPVLRDGSMRFQLWGHGTGLRSGDFGLQEPSAGDYIDPADLSVVIVPLVSFDKQSNRTGRGAGYYDRAFGPSRDSPTRAIRIGAAFEVQRTATVPTRDHDVPMDAMVTELGIRWTPDGVRWSIPSHSE